MHFHAEREIWGELELVEFAFRCSEIAKFLERHRKE